MKLVVASIMKSHEIEMQDYLDFLQEVLIPEDRLQARIGELAAEISADYEGKPLMLACILRGGVLFLTDLMRALTIPHTIDFMAVSSYGAGARESSGNVRITLDLQTSVEGKDVLLVEDIIDSGLSMRTLMDYINLLYPRSVRICVLIDKQERREIDIDIDYVGCVI